MYAKHIYFLLPDMYDDLYALERLPTIEYLQKTCRVLGSLSGASTEGNNGWDDRETTNRETQACRPLA